MKPAFQIFFLLFLRDIRLKLAFIK